MDSDTDSEADRRAFGQYASLSLEEEEGIDEEAADYLRSVRAEARTLPDIVTASTANDLIDQSGNELVGGTQSSGSHVTTQEKVTVATVSASPLWIRRFLKDFLDIRLKIQSLELAVRRDELDHVAQEVPASGLHNMSAPDAFCSSISQPPKLSQILLLSPMVVGQKLEEEIDHLQESLTPTAENVLSIYSLATALDYPLMADTDASMRKLVRICCELRKGEVNQGPTESAFLDILQVVGGAYFGQDEVLRLEYRECGLHI